VKVGVEPLDMLMMLPLRSVSDAAGVWDCSGAPICAPFAAVKPEALGWAPKLMMYPEPSPATTPLREYGGGSGTHGGCELHTTPGKECDTP